MVGERDGLVRVEVHRLHVGAQAEHAAALGGLGLGRRGRRRGPSDGRERGAAQLEHVTAGEGAKPADPW